MTYCINDVCWFPNWDMIWDVFTCCICCSFIYQSPIWCGLSVNWVQRIVVRFSCRLPELCQYSVEPLVEVSVCWVLQFAVQFFLTYKFVIRPFLAVSDLFWIAAELASPVHNVAQLLYLRAQQMLVEWHSSWTSVFGRRTFPVAHSTFSWWLEVSQLGQLSLSSSQGRQMSSELQLDVRHLNQWWRHLVNVYEVKTQAWWKVTAAYHRGWLKKSLADWLFVHQDQLQAQHSVKSMGELQLYLTTNVS